VPRACSSTQHRHLLVVLSPWVLLALNHGVWSDLSRVRSPLLEEEAAASSSMVDGHALAPTAPVIPTLM
jgi:hypothetical protein